MNQRNLFYIAYITLLYTIVYGLTLDEVKKIKDYGSYLCKDNICVDSSSYRDDYSTIVIPNKEGKNVTYITDTCGIKDIDLDLCTSKECTSDSQCLSNKCVKGHCCFNENMDAIECQYVRTVHNNPLFGDPKGYKMQCGLPRGNQCKSNDDCSSYNCETYTGSNICGYPDESGCHSLCGLESYLIMRIFIPAAVVLLLVIACCCCCCCESGNNKKSKLEEKNTV